jgi:hypothetical protein
MLHTGRYAVECGWLSFVSFRCIVRTGSKNPLHVSDLL